MSPWSKIGIIAGGGQLPVHLSVGCEQLKKPFFVIRLAGASDAALSGFPGVDCAVGEAGKILNELKTAQCDAVVFAGVVRRPDLSKLKADWRGASLMPKILSAAARGDASILNILVDEVEKEGMKVVAVEQVLSELAAPIGQIAGPVPSQQNFLDIKKAASLIHAIGDFDVGQGAVVANGLVLAIEAAEGTDMMLKRCAVLPNGINIGGVLVKRPKPDQELRIDLPTIGSQTVANAKKAGLAGIAIEAGMALIVDRDQVIKLANEAGLFLYGFSEQELISE